jgi:hypothetical protein
MLDLSARPSLALQPIKSVQDAMKAKTVKGSSVVAKATILFELD